MVTELRYSGGPTNKFGITSIGGVISSENIPNGNLNNLFDNVNRVEVINGRIEYRMFWIHNADAINYLKAQMVTILIPADTEISFAVDSAILPQLLATEDNTPIGLSFLKFSDYLSLKIPLGTYNINGDIPIWIKRKVLVGTDAVKTISMVLNATDNNITISGDFGSIENSIDNFNIRVRNAQFFTNVDFCGEALLS